MREIGHFIGGKAVKGASGRFGDIFDPNTGEVQAKVALAKHSEVEHAIANAQAAQPAWAATNPQIDLVYAHNDPGAHGAFLAAKESGREKSMKFVGIDALPHEGVQYVKDGVLQATFAYPTGGAEAIDSALKLLRKDTVPKQVVLGTKSYTSESAAKGGEAIP